MAYEPLNLPDNAIPEGADITHIEGGITELSTSLAEQSQYIASQDDLANLYNSLSEYESRMIVINADMMSVLTYGNINMLAIGTIAKLAGTTGADFLVATSSSRTIVTGRVNPDGTILRSSYVNTTVYTS